MTTMLLDASTGFAPEEELDRIAEKPEGDVAEHMPMATSWPCGISASVSAISIAWGDGCPSTACTTQC